MEEYGSFLRSQLRKERSVDQKSVGVVGMVDGLGFWKP
jgi:hypothetical protein